jgi:hypothetical protein
MELYQKVQELGEANHEFLLRYNWEWFCSLNLQSGSDYSMAESKLKAWRIKMGIQDHMLIAYMGAFNTINNPHIHLLLWGKRNILGRSLLDLNYKDWENEWSRLTKCQAVIEPIYEREGIASYIAKKNLPWGKSELIQPYNKRLLEKARVG